MPTRLIVTLVLCLAAVTPAGAWPFAERGQTKHLVLDGPAPCTRSAI